MRRAAAVIAAAAVVFAPATASAAPAPAPSWDWWMGNCYPGGGIRVPFFSECDGPPVNPQGDHWRCVEAPLTGWCGWVNTGNQPIPAPPL